MSKNIKQEKRKGCQYKFVQGSMKGKRCNKSCRGQYCKAHNRKRLQYQKKYYTKTKDKSFNEKLKQLEIKDISTISLEREQSKLRMYTNEYKFCAKTLIGINIFLGINQDKAINIVKECSLGKCTCIKVKTADDIPKKAAEMLMNEDQFKTYYKTGKDQLIKYAKANYKCTKCSECKGDLYCHFGEPEHLHWGTVKSTCKFCCYPLGRVFFFEFKDKSYNLALAKKKKLLKKMKEFHKKINHQKQIIELIEKRIKEK